MAINLLATYPLGSFDPASPPQELAAARKARYTRLFDLADAYLSRGLSVWVDGNFPTRALRSQILSVARRHGVSEVTVIRCFCSSPDCLEKRFQSRRDDPYQPDAAANDISVYHTSVKQFEPLVAGELEGFADWEILEYDSCRKVLELQERPGSFGLEISRQMATCKFLSHA